MINFKEEIANKIAKVLEKDTLEIIPSIEVPKDKKQGDYAFPCFRLAKVLKKAPQIIAEELSAKIEKTDGLIEKTEVARGYLNFFINKKALVKTVVCELREKKYDYGKSNIGKRKEYYCRIFFS